MVRYDFIVEVPRLGPHKKSANRVPCLMRDNPRARPRPQEYMTPFTTQTDKRSRIALSRCARATVSRHAGFAQIVGKYNEHRVSREHREFHGKLIVSVFRPFQVSHVSPR